VRLRGVGPEQGGELAAGMGLAGPEGEIGQEGLGLPEQADGRVRRQSGFEAPEEREAKTRHVPPPGTGGGSL
jgi:hypothetical protein